MEWQNVLLVCLPIEDGPVGGGSCVCAPMASPCSSSHPGMQAMASTSLAEARWIAVAGCPANTDLCPSCYFNQSHLETTRHVYLCFDPATSDLLNWHRPIRLPRCMRMPSRSHRRPRSLSHLRCQRARRSCHHCRLPHCCPHHCRPRRRQPLQRHRLRRCCRWCILTEELQA